MAGSRRGDRAARCLTVAVCLIVFSAACAGRGNPGEPMDGGTGGSRDAGPKMDMRGPDHPRASAEVQAGPPAEAQAGPPAEAQAGPPAEAQAGPPAEGQAGPPEGQAAVPASSRADRS